jgi:hypothetical protein
VLYLDAPIGPIRGLTILRDHADPDLFYYMNDRPRLARNDGVPEFVFLKYKRDITDNPSMSAEDKERLGGGFLAFTVDLSVDEAVLDDVRRRLAVFAAGTPKLTPVQYRKGTVRLSITKDLASQPDAPAGTAPQSTFFEEVYGATKPSLIGDNRATFGVTLNHEGATAMEAALKSGISPIGVIYDLEYLGLRPAFDVKIHADYKRIYNHLEIEFGLKAGYGPISAAVDIGLAWQKLRDDGSITVQVIKFTDDADLRRQADAAFDWFKTELLRDFFKSSLEPPTFMRQGQGGLVGALQSLLGPLTQSQQGSPNPALGAPTTAAPTVAAPPVGPNSGLVSLADTNRAATAGAGGQASATHGTGGGPAAGGFGIQLGFSLKRIEQEELKERDFEYSEQAAVAMEAAPQGLFSTMVSGLDLRRAMKEINLDDDFFKRIAATFTLAADLAAEKIAAITVNVEYPAERPPGVQPDQVAGFAFTAQDSAPKKFETFLNEHLDLRYRYRLAVDFTGDNEWEGDEPHYEAGWVTTTGPSVGVDPFSALDRFDLEVVVGSDLAESDVRQVQVELVYEDPGTGFRAARTMTFKPTDASGHWKLRFGEATTRTYRYRITYFLPNNVRVQTDWVEGDPVTTERGSLTLHSPFRGQFEFRVVPVLDPALIIEADLDVLYREADTGYERRQTITFPGGGGPLGGQTVTLPTLAEHPGGVVTTTTVVRADGSVFEGPPTDVPAVRKVILSDGVGQTRRIQVNLSSADLSAAGLLAVRVRLRGSGDHGDRDEAFFVPGDPATKFVALVQPDGGQFSYAYEVEAYTTAGLPRPGVSGSTSDMTLVVPLPQ